MVFEAGNIKKQSTLVAWSVQSSFFSREGFHGASLCQDGYGSDFSRDQERNSMERTKGFWADKWPSNVSPTLSAIKQVPRSANNHGHLMSHSSPLVEALPGSKDSATTVQEHPEQQGRQQWLKKLHVQKKHSILTNLIGDDEGLLYGVSMSANCTFYAACTGDAPYDVGG